MLVHNYVNYCWGISTNRIKEDLSPASTTICTLQGNLRWIKLQPIGVKFMMLYSHFEIMKSYCNLMKFKKI